MDPDKPLGVISTAWGYADFVLGNLARHRGPILNLGNFEPDNPGLVFLLSLNGGMKRFGIPYSTTWSEKFDDAFFNKGLNQWLRGETITHDTSHITPFSDLKLPGEIIDKGTDFAGRFMRRMRIYGLFDEHCMGMEHAVFPDELLWPMGISKQYMSQSTLAYETQRVNDGDAWEVYNWLLLRGMKFELGPDEETDLTENQVLIQCKMYIAAVRLAKANGFAAIGIQYQQGLKDSLPASDLVEGLLNQTDRPPVYDEKTGEVLFAGSAIPHANEVDEMAGIDGLVSYHLWRELGIPADNTNHDLRWGAV
ncbi:MAG: fucose isomerase, partial [Candidatus Margulisiibacteriota bacterium]